jgi:hypothetical protein
MSTVGKLAVEHVAEIAHATSAAFWRVARSPRALAPWGTLSAGEQADFVAYIGRIAAGYGRDPVLGSLDERRHDVLMRSIAMSLLGNPFEA